MDRAKKRNKSLDVSLDARNYGPRWATVARDGLGENMLRLLKILSISLIAHHHRNGRWLNGSIEQAHIYRPHFQLSTTLICFQKLSLSLFLIVAYMFLNCLLLIIILLAHACYPPLLPLIFYHYLT